MKKEGRKEGMGGKEGRKEGISRDIVAQTVAS